MRPSGFCQPAHVADLAHVADAAECRALVGDVGQARVRDRDVVRRDVPHAVAHVALPAEGAGDETVLGFVDAGLFLELPGRADDVGFPRALAPALRYFPQEGSLAPRVL